MEDNYDAIPIAADIKMIMNSYFVKNREQMPPNAAVEITKLLNNVYHELSTSYQNILDETVDGKVDSDVIVDQFRKLKKNIKLSLCGDLVDVVSGTKEK